MTDDGDATSGTPEIESKADSGLHESNPQTEEVRPGLTGEVIHLPAKPSYLAIAGAPSELKALPNFVVWRAEQPKPGKTKWRKVPYTPLKYTERKTPSPAITTDLTTWRTYDQAVQAYRTSQGWKRPFDGLGFVFDGKADEDGLCLCGVDLDKLTDRAREIVVKLATYTEISPSGNGVHAITRAKPFEQKVCKTAALEAEAYCGGRYFTVTGHLDDGSVPTIENRPDEIVELLAEIAACDNAAKAKPASGATAGRKTNYLALLREPRKSATGSGEAEQGRSLSKLFVGLPLESLGGVEPEPLNLEKLKLALWALADEWLASEGNWMTVCRICANEAMRAGAGQFDIRQALWEALDERSRGVEGYDEEDNQKRFERCIADWGKVKPPILAGSLYQEAERQGWIWTPTPSSEDAAAVGGGTGGAGGTGRGAASSPAPGGKTVKPLRGRTLYALAYNMLAALPSQFRYDEMHDRCFYNGEHLSDALYARFRAYCINVADEHKDPKLPTVREAAEALCDLSHFDPEKDQILSLTWDGVQRLELLLPSYCGVMDMPLARAVGRKFMIGKVKRALEPGCMHDWALVLEGPQGCGKTSFARILAGSPDRIIDAEIIKADKAQLQQEALLGRTIHEIAEMSDIRKADINAVKAFMSRTHDRARGAYAHSLRDQPRRCVHIGTTNDAQYLPDEENRRFFPFKVGVIDLVALARDRDQLHAEAVAALKKGEDNVVPRALWAVAAKEQRKRRIEDPWEDIVGDWIRVEIAGNARGAGGGFADRDGYSGGPMIFAPRGRQVKEIDHKGGRVWFITSTVVLTDILRVPTAQQHGLSGRRARAVMGRLGWEAARIEIDKHTMRGFIYDLGARGIAAGEWGKYRDALDEEEEAITPESNAGGGAYSESRERAHQQGGKPEDDINGVLFEDDDLESEAVTLDDDGKVVRLKDWIIRMAAM